MIRFINLRGQGTGYRFAFFDTVTDSFFGLENQKVWSTLRELEETPTKAHAARKLRMINLCPEWTREEPTEEEEGFKR